MLLLCVATHSNSIMDVSFCTQVSLCRSMLLTPLALPKTCFYVLLCRFSEMVMAEAVPEDNKQATTVVSTSLGQSGFPATTGASTVPIRIWLNGFFALRGDHCQRHIWDLQSSRKQAQRRPALGLFGATRFVAPSN